MNMKAPFEKKSTFIRFFSEKTSLQVIFSHPQQLR